MQRRTLLAALAALPWVGAAAADPAASVDASARAATAPAPSPPDARAASAASAAVRCDGRWWGVGPAPEAVALDNTLAVPPAVGADALWLADTLGRLQRRVPSAGWAADAEVTLHGPVLALAARADGQLVAAAHGHELSLVDARGRLVARWRGEDLARRQQSAAGELFFHDGRHSLVVTWPGLGESWELSLDPDAPPIFDGLVHDYRMGEAIASRGHLHPRRAPLGAPLPEALFSDPRAPWFAGLEGDAVAVVHLDVRRRVGRWTLPGARPALGVLTADGLRWWLPVGATLQAIDTRRWQPAGELALPGEAAGLQALATGWRLLTADGLLWQGAPGAWQRVALPGRATALAPVADGGAWVTISEPEALLRLDAAGAVARRVALPAAAQQLVAVPAPLQRPS